jgi:DNA-directed RNA polymerase subunit RPC12/RpoP
MPKIIPGHNDLATTFPDIAALWHPTKNLPLMPTEASTSGHAKYWWLCSLGHSYLTTPQQIRIGQGCGVCAGRQVELGFNDLATTNPQLASEWDFAKNLPLTPQNTIAGTHLKVWWKCGKGHSWQASGLNRSKGKGCPYCSGRYLLVGFNDMQTTNPELAKEWHPSKNAPLTPLDVQAGTNKKIWWQCSKGHEWHVAGNFRLADKTGCPVCSNRITVTGLNDLATTNPVLTKEWNFPRNESLRPTGVQAGSHSKVWWQCAKGHEWRAQIANRNSGIGCPICSNKTLQVGANDLASQFPALAAEWDYSRNGTRKPTDVIAGSNSKAHWIDSKGHQWEAQISSRTGGRDCPYCSSRKVLQGFNDLRTTSLRALAEWNFKRNGDLKPESFMRGSHNVVWWQCSHGHEWQGSIASRALAVHGCPVCLNQLIVPGINDFGTRMPNLAKEWDTAKNEGVNPTGLSLRSNKKYWWICPEGHSYKSTILGRANGTGCQKCAQFGYDPNLPGLLYFIENLQLGAMKIGITNLSARTDRLASFRKAGWTVLKTVEKINGHVVSEAETLLLRWVRNDLKLPPFLTNAEMRSTKGASETFSGEAITSHSVGMKIDEVFMQVERLNG